LVGVARFARCVLVINCTFIGLGSGHISMFSEYKDSVEESVQIVRQVVTYAGKHQLALNPIVYTVLYQHSGGINAELSRQLDQLRQQGQLTQANVESLYHTHIYESDLKNAQSINNAVGNIINFTQGAISRIEGDTQQYSDQLNSATQRLSATIGESGVESLLTTLLEETQVMYGASLKLRTELSEAHQKIEQMNQEFNRIRHESLTDPLTGLKNRRAFDKEIAQLCTSAQVAREPLSLLIVDIDHFKVINDTHGHVVGDGVIKRVAQWLTESVRGQDVVARFGGEEFVLILPMTSLAGAASVVENIRASIAKRTLRYGEKAIGKITISVGAAQMGHTEEVESLVNRADQMLYLAKREGRNRVALARPV